MGQGEASLSHVNTEEISSVICNIARFLADASVSGTGTTFSTYNDSRFTMPSGLSTPATTNASASRDYVDALCVGSCRDVVAPGLIPISPKPSLSGDLEIFSDMENKVGDVIEPEHGLIAIGSGGAFAQSAALALMDNTDLNARDIVVKSLNIAADICIYTNKNQTIEELKY